MELKRDALRHSPDCGTRRHLMQPARGIILRPVAWQVFQYGSCDRWDEVKGDSGSAEC